jgi:hypothetical protein
MSSLAPANPWDAASESDISSQEAQNIIHSSPLLESFLDLQQLSSNALPPLQMEIPPSFYACSNLGEILGSSRNCIPAASSTSSLVAAPDPDPWNSSSNASSELLGGKQRAILSTGFEQDFRTGESPELQESVAPPLSRSQTPILRKYETIDHIKVIL